MDNALKAHALFRATKTMCWWQDKKVISAGEKLNPKLPVEVVIVDEFTGRLMQGRRYSEGLHEAIEAKEGISVRGPRARPSPPSPSRTTSASIPSWRA